MRAAVRELRGELLRRADIIDSLTREECPESKVTSPLADKRRDFCPIVVGIDETQSYFEYGDEGNKAHKAIRQELAAGVTELVKLGPALGIIVLLASQNVTATTIPRPISTNAAFRACLKVADQIANDQILGTSAYSQGLDATQLDYSDKGVLFLRADGSRTRIVRTVDQLDAMVAESIAARARSYRDAAGLLTGDAAGETATDEAVQVTLLDDARDVMDHPPTATMLLSELRDALALLRPGTWGHLDNGALGSLLRTAGVRVATVWSRAAKSDGKGIRRGWLDVAATDDVEPDEDSGGAVVRLTR